MLSFPTFSPCNLLFGNLYSHPQGLLPALSWDALACITYVVLQAMSPPLGGTLVLSSPRPTRIKQLVVEPN